jgi:tetratricopeptide (TPR) repeat protein
MREVLAINSNNADALNFIGYLYAERGIHLREARILIKKALAVKPDDGYILDSLGWVYYKMESYKKARTYLEQAHRLVPDDPTIAEHLGDAYNRLNKTEKALELYRRALELAPGAQAVQQKINDLEGL